MSLENQCLALVFYIILTKISFILTIIVVKMNKKCYNIFGNNDKGGREDYGKAF